MVFNIDNYVFWKKTVLLFPSQCGYFFFFPTLLHWIGPPIKRWMEVVRLDILLYSWSSEKTFNLFKKSFFFSMSFFVCFYFYSLSLISKQFDYETWCFLCLKICFICRLSFYQIWKIFKHFSIFILVSPHISFGDFNYRYIWSLNVVPQFTNVN